MAADQLRVLQSVAGNFGFRNDASRAATQVFYQNMRAIRNGVGKIMGFLQSQNQVVAPSREFQRDAAREGYSGAT